MKLLTKADLKKLQAQDPYHPTGPGRELKDPMVLVKFFTPDCNWTWYAVSASQDEKTGNVQFYGVVEGEATEWGYFWLSELVNVTGPLGLGVERDLYWTPIPVSELMPKLRK